MLELRGQQLQILYGSVSVWRTTAMLQTAGPVAPHKTGETLRVEVKPDRSVLWVRPLSFLAAWPKDVDLGGREVLRSPHLVLLLCSLLLCRRVRS